MSGILLASSCLTFLHSSSVGILHLFFAPAKPSSSFTLFTTVDQDCSASSHFSSFHFPIPDLRRFNCRKQMSRCSYSIFPSFPRPTSSFSSASDESNLIFARVSCIPSYFRVDFFLVLRAGTAWPDCMQFCCMILTFILYILYILHEFLHIVHIANIVQYCSILHTKLHRPRDSQSGLQMLSSADRCDSESRSQVGSAARPGLQVSRGARASGLGPQRKGAGRRGRPGTRLLSQ